MNIFTRWRRKMRPHNYPASGLLVFGLIQIFSATGVKAQSKADQLVNDGTVVLNRKISGCLNDRSIWR
jgi:hypothetical protein